VGLQASGRQARGVPDRDAEPRSTRRRTPTEGDEPHRHEPDNGG
jgi:hypothetical protein